MKFKCKQKELNEALNNVIRAVPQKSPMQALEGVKMYLDNNDLELTGYDLEIGIRTTIKVNSEDHGEFVVNARIFSDIVRKMPDDDITIEVDEKLKVTIKGKKAEYNILALTADDYPSIPDIDKSDFFEFPQAVLKNMINQTIFAVSQNDSKPILKGELFDIENGLFTLVAIDGFRLAIRREKIETDDRFNFVVKAKALNEVTKLLRDDEEAKVTVYVTRKHVVFDLNGYMLITRLLEGEFHNYRGSVPQSHSTEVIVNTRDVIDMLERCMLLIVEHTKAAVRCIFENGEIKVSCSTSLGNFSDSCNADITGDITEIGFNCKYFIEAMKAAESDKVKLQLGGNLAPMKIVPLDGDDYTFLLLPVRLKTSTIQ
ncbi:MAG: DNA polymerase III subunit beta [Oscillospiraceae bacterium]|nr:DNA polymerase III subunit beta [Oscillospiraceae bacterium]